jgi:hypothetical protein
MANTPEKISPALARQLIRDGNSDRLNTDPHAVDALNQSVIEEFRANQGRVSGPLEGWPVLLLTMTGAKTGRTLVRPVCYSRDGDRLVACNIENDSKICYQSACLEQLSDCRGPKLRNFVRECARGCFAPVTCGGRG